jgi:amidase
MTDTALLSATDLVRLLRTREVSSRELLERYLGRVEEHNGALNAVVTLDADRARVRAAEADEAAARGEWLGPLHGLPMTVKDCFETAGLRTTAGAEDLRDHVPTVDADTVARLRSAGAVIFGKTNTPTYAMDTQTYNPIFGTTNNPWDLERSPGGSSGGAAAAIAAGLAGLELGSDIGGSIRNPSHYCGVFGLKPTHGIVAGRGHIPGPPGTLSTTDLGVFGPLARSADDLGLALDVLAGPAPEAAVAWRLHLPPPRHTALGDYRLAAWIDDPFCPVDADVRGLLQATVDMLTAAGAKVDETARPVDLEEASTVYNRLLAAAICNGVPQAVYDALMQLADQLPPDDDSYIAMQARNLTQRARDWNTTNEHRHRIQARWAEFFRRFDALLCPIVPTTAIPHDHSELTQRTITVNGAERPYFDQLVWAGLVTGPLLPAAVVPVGTTAAGLPVGVQIVAPYLEDRTAIDLAKRVAQVTGGYRPPPGFGD